MQSECKAKKSDSSGIATEKTFRASYIAKANYFNGICLTFHGVTFKDHEIRTDFLDFPYMFLYNLTTNMATGRVRLIRLFCQSGPVFIKI